MNLSFFKAGASSSLCLITTHFMRSVSAAQEEPDNYAKMTVNCNMDEGDSLKEAFDGDYHHKAIPDNLLDKIIWNTKPDQDGYYQRQYRNIFLGGVPDEGNIFQNLKETLDAEYEKLKEADSEACWPVKNFQALQPLYNDDNDDLFSIGFLQILAKCDPAPCFEFVYQKLWDMNTDDRLEPMHLCKYFPGKIEINEGYGNYENKSYNGTYLEAKYVHPKCLKLKAGQENRLFNSDDKLYVWYADYNKEKNRKFSAAEARHGIKWQRGWDFARGFPSQKVIEEWVKDNHSFPRSTCNIHTNTFYKEMPCEFAVRDKKGVPITDENGELVWQSGKIKQLADTYVKCSYVNEKGKTKTVTFKKADRRFVQNQTTAINAQLRIRTTRLIHETGIREYGFLVYKIVRSIQEIRKGEKGKVQAHYYPHRERILNDGTTGFQSQFLIELSSAENELLAEMRLS